MDRDRLQWVFDDGGFVNTVSLDLVVVFNLSPSHFFSNSVVLGWAWLAMGGGLHCNLWGLCLQLGVGLILVVFRFWVVFCGVLLVVMVGDHGGFGLWS